MSSHSSASPDAMRAGLRRGRPIGTIHRDAFSILIRKTVLEEILDYSERDLRRELGGFLLGEARAGADRHVVVRHFLPAADVHSQRTSLTFTHETWAAMAREAARCYPEDMVVGWHHTHPGLGVFLSGYDLFIHRHFFNEPWQIALVVDPRRRELGFFQWLAGRVTDCGFVCLRE